MHKNKNPSHQDWELKKKIKWKKIYAKRLALHQDCEKIWKPEYFLQNQGQCMLLGLSFTPKEIIQEPMKTVLASEKLQTKIID